jgi:hypothetical protein
MTTTDQDPAMSAAAREVHGAVLRVVTASAPLAFTVAPIWPGSPLTERQPAPVPALRAAVLLSRLFSAEARRQVRRAREAGVSWADLAPVLDAEDGQAAFEWATGGAEDSWRRAAVTYRCPSCGGLVSDYGPYENHPDDNESGHAPDCARHLAALVTWFATNADDWDDDTDGDDTDAGDRDGDGSPGVGA